MNEDLIKYTEENIFPEYSKNEVGHGIDHIKYVIKRSFDIVIIILVVRHIKRSKLD